MFKNPFIKKAEPAEGEQWIPFLRRNGYSDAAVASAAPKLEHMDPDLKKSLLRWDKIGDLPDREIEGFTVAGLIEYADLHPIGAFLMMDWLLREPEEAKYALAQPVSGLEITTELLSKLEESEAKDHPDEEPG